MIVQPTHIINGIENDRMMEDLMEHMSFSTGSVWANLF